MRELDWPKPPKWMERAVCAQIDGDMFFPIVGESSRIAIRICQTCPVMRECGDLADANKETSGVWGGKSRGRKPRSSDAMRRGAA